MLAVRKNETYLDATIGGGGHAKEIIKRGGRVFAIDCDKEAVTFAKERLRSACPNAPWQIIKANFVDLSEMARKYHIPVLAGIIFDLGTSQHQLLSFGRGFSFSIDEPLDMRMDQDLSVTAADLVNGLGKKELMEVFTKYGEEKLARPIAEAICRERKNQPIKYSGLLANIVSQVYNQKRRLSKIHPATKVFQALRITVNDELNSLKKALPQALALLKKGARLVVISFHGLEDRIVKDFFKHQANIGILQIITKKPVIPGFQEISANPSCRSAKLRAGEKL